MRQRDLEKLVMVTAVVVILFVGTWVFESIWTNAPETFPPELRP